MNVISVNIEGCGVRRTRRGEGCRPPFGRLPSAGAGAVPGCWRHQAECSARRPDPPAADRPTRRPRRHARWRRTHRRLRARHAPPWVRRAGSRHGPTGWSRGSGPVGSRGCGRRGAWEGGRERCRRACGRPAEAGPAAGKAGEHLRPPRDLRLPPGQYPTESFPALSAGPISGIPTYRCSFTVTGEAGESRSWTWDEMMALPQ